MKIMNKDFGNRCWGLSIGLFFFVNPNASCHIYLRILSSLLFMYFIIYGAERFTPDYKKVI